MVIFVEGEEKYPNQAGRVWNCNSLMSVVATKREQAVIRFKGELLFEIEPGEFG